MPVVTIQIVEGGSAEQKRDLARAITDAVVEHTDAKPDCLHVVIQEIEADNWARAGVVKTASEPS